MPASVFQHFVQRQWQLVVGSLFEKSFISVSVGDVLRRTPSPTAFKVLIKVDRVT